MRATVTPVSAALATADPGAVDTAFLLKNMTATETIYVEVGGAADPAVGFAWEVMDGPISIVLDRGEVLNACVRAGGANQTVHVLQAGK